MIEKIRKEALEYFKDLQFEEEAHIYTVNGKRQPSVSGLIKKFYEPFDTIGISERKAKREGLNAQDLRDEWKATNKLAIDIGNKAHLFGENYAIDRTLKAETGFDEAIIKFWKDLPPHIVPIVLELKMHHKEYEYCGTADIPLYDTINNCFIIADYKTNKDLFKNFAGKRMLHQFKNFLDNPFNHYQIQLSYYQILMEQLGHSVSRRIIVWITEKGEYTMYDTEDLTSILINDLKNK